LWQMKRVGVGGVNHTHQIVKSAKYPAGEMQRSVGFARETWETTGHALRYGFSVFWYAIKPKDVSGVT